MGIVKRYATRILKTIAFLYIVAPLTYVLYLAIAFDVPADVCVGLLISPTYYLTTLTAMMAGYGLWEMRRWSWYVLLIADGLAIAHSAKILVEFGETHHKFLAFLLTAGLLGLSVYRVAKEIRVPYYFPRVRWWESDPRFRLAAPVILHRTNGTELRGEIQDVSIGGIFVKLRPDLPQDESVSIDFTLYGHKIGCTGTVVWCAGTAVTHSKGVGVKFDQVVKSDRRALRAISRRLRKIATLYRKSRYLLSADEFAKEWEAIEKRALRPARLTGVRLRSKT